VPYRADHQCWRLFGPTAECRRSSGAPCRLHIGTAVVPVLMRIARVGGARPLMTRSVASHLCQFIASSGPPDLAYLTLASDRLDQARVIVLEVSDPRADGPAAHLFRRKGREHGLELARERGSLSREFMIFAQRRAGRLPWAVPIIDEVLYCRFPNSNEPGSW
jgi:hypothetical protein